jgi:hypothetical protein
VRRIVMFVVLGLGIFAVALGLLLRLYTYPRLTKVPLDVNATAFAEASDATALEFVEQPDGSVVPEIKTGLTLSVTQRVVGDLTQPEVASGGNVASWIEGVEVKDGSGNRVHATERQLCLDRRTGESIQPCASQYVQSKTNEQTLQPLRENGAAQPGHNFKFPFDTEKRGYQLYDITLHGASEAKFEAEDQLDGLPVYRFVQDIPATKVDSRKVPGELVGKPDATVDADLYYQNRRTYWVEPATGQIVKTQEHQHQELRPLGESTGTVVFDAAISLTNQTLHDLVTTAKDSKSKLALLTTLPIYLWIGGGLTAAFAAALLWRRARAGRGIAPHTPDPHSSATSSTPAARL